MKRELVLYPSRLKKGFRTSAMPGGRALGVGVGIAGFILMNILGAVGGFIGGAILAFICTIVPGAIGGIEMDLETKS